MLARVGSLTFDDVLERDQCVLLNESVEFDCCSEIFKFGNMGGGFDAVP